MNIFFWYSNLVNQLNRIEQKLDLILKKEVAMSATIDQLVADVTAETTLEGSIITLLNNVEAQLKAALANTVIAPADQAKLDSMFSDLESNKAALAAAIAANTPVAPTSSASAKSTQSTPHS